MATKENKVPGYAEAINEIETILARFEDEQFDIDTLSVQVKRAAELIKLCKEKLRKAEDDVEAILKQE